jgi:phenylpropionate dioxygenase-like ring-hydroxylating dioxygenase large terminal subunit
MTTTTEFAQLVRKDEVHASVYTDPAIFDREMNLVFGRTWIFIGHESEVPQPGDFKTDRIGRWPILLTRHSDGVVRVFHNICRHRGATLCHEAAGNDRAFTCMYHGWTFGSDGRLIGVPLQERLHDFDPADYGLIPLPRVGSYRGFVFGSLSEHGPSLDDFLGAVKPYLDLMVERAPNRRLTALKPVKYEYRGNWKLQNENFSENYHPAVLHQSAFAIRARANGSPALTMKRAASATREVVLAHGHAAVDFRGSRRTTRFTVDDEYEALLAQRDGPERAAELRDCDIHILIYPNVLLHTLLNHYRVIKPVAVDRTEINVYPCTLDGAPSAVNQRLVHNTVNHVSPVGIVQVDDLQAFDWVQDGLAAGVLDWIPLKLHGDEEHINANGDLEWIGASEGIIRHQYQAWQRLMTAG